MNSNKNHYGHKAYKHNDAYIFSLKLHGRNLGSFGPGKKNAGNLQSAICSFAKCQPNQPYKKMVSIECHMPV